MMTEAEVDEEKLTTTPKERERERESEEGERERRVDAPRPTDDTPAADRQRTETTRRAEATGRTGVEATGRTGVEEGCGEGCNRSKHYSDNQPT